MSYLFYTWLLWKLIRVLGQFELVHRWQGRRIERRKGSVSVYPQGRGPPVVPTQWPLLVSANHYKRYAAGLWVLVRR